MNKLIGEERRAKIVARKITPNLIPLSPIKEASRLEDMKILIERNCPKTPRSLFATFLMLKA